VEGLDLAFFLREEVMHQPIRDNLEEYLKGSTRQVPQAFHAHLVACEECASELRLLETQANMLRSLRSVEDIGPIPGFYARVRERIEDQGRISVWSIFLQPSFGRRLAIASAALVVLLGTYLVTTEPGDQSVASIPSVATDIVSRPAPEVSAVDDSLQQQRQRNAVLVDLASFHE
jgi:predicted anti-sigma-YlaC factor YlaD